MRKYEAVVKQLHGMFPRYAIYIYVGDRERGNVINPGGWVLESKHECKYVHLHAALANMICMYVPLGETCNIIVD